MGSPERHYTLDLESQTPPEGQRISVAYHPYFSGYHHDLHRNLVELLAFNDAKEEILGRRFPIGHSSEFPDDSPFFAVLEREKNYRSDSVIAPAWIAPPFPDAIWSIFEIGNAFTQSRGGNEQALTDRLILALPYAELRQDKNSPPQQRTYWPEEAREAVNAQIVASTIATCGVSEVIFVHPHSAEGIQFFDNVVETLSLTTAPIFADWLIAKGYVDDNTEVVALDEGAAQECNHQAKLLSRLTGCNVGLTVLKKDRPEYSVVRKQDLIIGNPRGKRAIIRDDLAASWESLLKTGQALKEYGCTESVICITHGVFSGKYLRNIAALQKLGIIKDVAITNSLPQAEDAPFMPIKLDVLPLEQMLAFFARQVATSSIQEVKATSEWQDYILTPRPKEEFVEELRQHLARQEIAK